MDAIDRAQEIETLHREAALAAAITKPSPQLVINGQILCQECEEPIPTARLKRMPLASRCVDCQEIHEHKGRLCNR